MKPDMPFGDWIDLWHPYYCKPALRATTVDSYENYIYRHMIPEIGSIPLCNLTHNDLQQFYAITDTMRAQAAVKIDREIGGTNAPLPESTDSKASEPPTPSKRHRNGF